MRSSSKLRLGLACCVALVAIPGVAAATPYTHAEYSVRVWAVVTSNQPQEVVASASDVQKSIAAQPVTSQVSGQASFGTIAGLGFGIGHGLAIAEPGVLRASVSAETQALARPDSSVGSGVVSDALAEFDDELIFTPAHPVYNDQLIVNGELILTGDLDGTGYLRVAAGGTGLSPTAATGEWVGEVGIQKSAKGVYSPWTPGDPVAIPFSFTVSAGQASEVRYWLRVHADNGNSFGPCAATNGLCNIIEVGESTATADYSHTLTWHVTTVTDWFETAVGVGITSSSGFDYLLPEPGSGASLLVAVATLAALRRRKRSAR